MCVCVCVGGGGGGGGIYNLYQMWHDLSFYPILDADRKRSELCYVYSN